MLVFVSIVTILCQIVVLFLFNRFQVKYNCFTRPAALTCTEALLVNDALS